MTEMVKGKTIEEALKITWRDVAEALGGLPPVKMHCSVLAIDGLKSAIKNYLGENNNSVLNEKEVVDILSKIVYPAVSMDLISLKLLNYLKITEEGDVIIELLLSDDDPFKSHIKQEIEENLRKIPEIRNIEVRFIK
jgi:nitrogen fixation NifU-like protein